MKQVSQQQTPPLVRIKSILQGWRLPRAWALSSTCLSSLDKSTLTVNCSMTGLETGDYYSLLPPCLLSFSHTLSFSSTRVAIFFLTSALPSIPCFKVNETLSLSFSQIVSLSTSRYTNLIQLRSERSRCASPSPWRARSRNQLAMSSPTSTSTRLQA